MAISLKNYFANIHQKQYFKKKLLSQHPSGIHYLNGLGVLRQDGGLDVPVRPVGVPLGLGRLELLAVGRRDAGQLLAQVDDGVGRGGAVGLLGVGVGLLRRQLLLPIGDPSAEGLDEVQVVGQAGEDAFDGLCLLGLVLVA